MVFSIYRTSRQKGAVCHGIYQNSNIGMETATKLSEIIIAQKASKKNVWMTKQIQDERRMDKLEENWRGLQLWFLKTFAPNSFSKFIVVVCIDWYDAWQIYFVFGKAGI